MPWLINASQLDKFRKNQKNLIILDATQHHDQQNAHQEFLEKHIPGAQFFPLDDFRDPETNHPNMALLNEKNISDRLGKLGIRNDYKIILYDNSATHTACRALWLLKLFGHNPQLLYILDGGLNAWEKHGGKIESGEVRFGPKNYTVQLQLQYLRTLDQIKQNLKNPTEQMIDVRHPVRYAGGPEPRPHMRRGHVPGSFCLPFAVLFEKDGTFLSLERARKKLSDIGANLNVPIVTTCGSGTTAPILNFLLDLLAVPNALYNGSWTEYGKDQLYPGEKSLEERPIETCID